MNVCKNILVRLLWLLSLLSATLAQSAENFRIEKVYMCEDVPDQLIKFYLTPKDATPGAQKVDINMTSPKAIGENALFRAIGYMEIRRHWIRLFDHEDDFCRIFKTYVGQLFYDIETAAAIIPGSCPIPRGTYHATGYTINYQRLKLQTFEFGRLKFRVESHDKNSKTLHSCVIIIINNSKT